VHTINKKKENLLLATNNILGNYSLDLRKFKKGTLSYKLNNSSFFGKEIKKKAIKHKLKLVYNLLNYSFVLDNFNKYFSDNTNNNNNNKFYSSKLGQNQKLNFLIKHINKYIPYIFSILFKLIKKGTYRADQHIADKVNKNIYFNHTFIKLLLPSRISKSFIFINRLNNINGNINKLDKIIPA
jgi:hypothetical protein